MKPILIHVPHASMYIPEEYRKTALISQEELEDENHFMCDTGVLELIPPAFANNTVVFPYSRLYCDVERFRDGSEPMEAYGMGFIYTSDSRGREMFCPTTEHRKSVSAIYDRHHSRLNRRTTKKILQSVISFRCRTRYFISPYPRRRSPPTRFFYTARTAKPISASRVIPPSGTPSVKRKTR